MQQFQINKSNLAETKIIESDDAEITIDTGEILVRIERFGFSANNITYAVAGETMAYWQFFKPAGPDGDGWGILPVWGFGEIIHSQVSELPIGERLFGYFPPSTHLVMKPQDIQSRRFYDGIAHRSQLPRGYNIYTRVASDPDYNKAGDEMHMLLYPLYLTSFSLWHFLKDNEWFGAEQIVLVSASSKTSIGLAYGLKSDAEAPEIVAITSPGNREFVNDLGVYDRCMTYDEMETNLQQKATVIVDMSGNSQFLGKMHTHLSDRMLKTVNVGLTHWENFGPNDQINKERSEFFFAPSQVQKSMKDWGAETFAKRSSDFLSSAMQKSSDWIDLKHLRGLEGLSEVYSDVLTGKQSPVQGLIVNVVD